MSPLTKIVFANGVFLIGCMNYALAGENEVCNKSTAQCPSGSIIVIAPSPTMSRSFTDEVLKFCDFNKSIVTAISAQVICVRK